jgi:tRNA pseudouridine38-40 synthase
MLWILILLFILFALVNCWQHDRRLVRLVGRVSYDGTEFRGWQSQGQRDVDPEVKQHRYSKSKRTIQDLMNKMIRRRFNMNNLHVTGSSRTDSGVHAKGQDFHFDLPMEACMRDASSKRVNNGDGALDLSFLEYSLNRMLPIDCKVHNISYAPIIMVKGDREDGSLESIVIPSLHKVEYEDKYDYRLDSYFHAISSAKRKKYVYRFCIAGHVDPCQKRYVSHFWHPKFNMAIFEECLNLFEGTHNFRAFANQIERTERVASYLLDPPKSINTIKHIYSVKLIDEGDGYYAIEFILTSALYRMVRNIVGTCKMCAENEISLDFVRSILENESDRYDRTSNPALAATAEGLCLHQVYFDQY